MLFLVLILISSLHPLQAQEIGRTVRGTVLDPQGGVILDVPVELVAETGETMVARTDETGIFRFENVLPGIYTLSVFLEEFRPYSDFVEVTGDSTQVIDLRVELELAPAQEEVLVESDSSSLSLSPEENAGATVLGEVELEGLPDDPDELLMALQAMAGGDEGQVYIDGFSGGRMPPPSAIREVRINRNPFSAEYERMGWGRIEILTKPGSDQFRGEFEVEFNDEALNSRNPFASERAPYQQREFEIDLDGPIIKDKASFFVDVRRRAIDENAIINAQILDQNLQPTRFNETVVTPRTGTGFSPRIDYQLSENHTLTGRYSYSRDRREGQGIGEFSLPSRAFDRFRNEHEVQLRETAILGASTINETRFQMEWGTQGTIGDNTEPSIRVLDAFMGGNSPNGTSSDENSELELHNITSWTSGSHSLKAGTRLMRQGVTDVSLNNFGGTFVFGGGEAPLLDENKEIILGPDGQPVMTAIDSLERYRRTILFQQLGRTPEEIRMLGGGATQFSIAAGNPRTAINQWEWAFFIQDDWRLRPNFMLSLGLRYEGQTNIDDKLDFAPRLGFAWSPGAGGSGRPNTVIRGGVGIFYDRVSESLALQQLRFDGTRQQEFIISDPNFFPNIPPLDQLEEGRTSQVLRRMDPGLQTPYSVQGGVSVERQLPAGFTLSVDFSGERTLHALRSLSLPAGPDAPEQVSRVFQYVSDGVANRRRLSFRLNNRSSRNFGFFSNYTLSRTNSNTDGSGTFAADPNQMDAEYGRANFDVRHRLFAGASISMPWNTSVNPFIIASSGRPFNITTGNDLNEDSVFTDRPAFASDPNAPGMISTPYGVFNPNPEPGDILIPRNFGEGPGFFSVNMRFRKVFSFGEEEASPDRRGQGGRGGGGWRGGGSDGRYNLSMSVQVRNLLNRTNFGSPVGNLSSPLFGESTSSAGGWGRGGASAGNRYIELEMRFSF